MLKNKFENSYENDEAKRELEHFLSLSVKSSSTIFDTFSKVEGAKVYGDEPLKRFIYIPGTRKDRVLLVAHADTVWDKNWQQEFQNDEIQSLSELNGFYYNGNPDSLCGLGADDRAGCAILYLLRNSGHSLLILDGEEHGQIGANFLKENYPDLYEELNNHQYALQFDRRDKNNYKCYDIPVTKEFKKFIENEYEYYDAGKKSRTDLVVICDKVCGANLSVGYYHEHTQTEMLCFDEWFNTYNKTKKMLEKEQKQYKTITSLKQEIKDAKNKNHKIENFGDEFEL